eukprot:scaffold12176_cov108-Cylindrotheca_fusiformis.AAC.1
MKALLDTKLVFQDQIYCGTFIIASFSADDHQVLSVPYSPVTPVAAPRPKKPARACLSQCMSHVSRLVPGDHPLLPGYAEPNRNRRKF